MTITKTPTCHPHFNLGLFDSQITLRAFSHLAQTFQSSPRTDSGLPRGRRSLQLRLHIRHFPLNRGMIVQFYPRRFPFDYFPFGSDTKKTEEPMQASMRCTSLQRFCNSTLTSFQMLLCYRIWISVRARYSVSSALHKDSSLPRHNGIASHFIRYAEKTTVVPLYAPHGGLAELWTTRHKFRRDHRAFLWTAPGRKNCSCYNKHSCKPCTREQP